LENVPGLLNWDGGSYFGQILRDLHEAGYDAEWDVIGADDVGAPHRRKRLWILAYATGERAGRRPEEFCEANGRQDGELLRKFIGAGEELAHTELCGRIHGQNEIEPTEDGVDALGDAGAEGELAHAKRQRSSREINQEGQTTRLCERDLWPSGYGEEQKGWEVQRTTKSGMGRTVDGVAYRNDRLKAIGNGQVPLVAYTAWNTLMGRIE